MDARVSMNTDRKMSTWTPSNTIRKGNERQASLQTNKTMTLKERECCASIEKQFE